MHTIEIDLGEVRYPVFIGKQLLPTLADRFAEYGGKGQPYFIIDEFIYEALFTELQSVIHSLGGDLFCIPAGKSNKTFAAAMSVFSDLDKKNISRDTTIIAIGGGVVGDLAGFVASCWYRGVSLIHVPTTLLSAVDSCLGGKTALNFRRTVNAVGTYHHPVSILVDISLLNKLPEREVASGFGEIIKYSALGATEITSILDLGKSAAIDKLGELIGLSLKEKERFVRNDVSESSNRLFLNFGHTIGHAIEFATVFNGAESLRHGEGVALGMVAIFKICIKLGLLEAKDLERLKRLLEEHGLPVVFHSNSIDMTRERLIEKVVGLAFKDKKRTSKALRLVVLNGWGNPMLYPTDDASLIAFGVREVIV